MGKNVSNYNILSLDGGGIKGLILLKQLIALENIVGMPLNKYFDMISGTSTGGIVATLLSLGMPAKDILQLYTKHGKNIFKKRFLRFGLFRPKYSDKYFNKLLKYYVGEHRLADIKDNELLLIGYDATIKDSIIFKSGEAKKNNKLNYSLFDAVRITASAPAYFKPHQIEGDSHYYIDGGLVVNNPALKSYFYAKKLINNHEHINIISFSTGSREKGINFKTVRGGKINWAKVALDIMLVEQAETTNNNLREIYNFESGLYTRCLSIIKNSSGVIDDASKKNINNMLLDGELSIDKNLDEMLDFIEITKIK
jgi:patatin-like phospholipase/acyl hydrolase